MYTIGFESREVGNSALSNESTNTSSISNPVKSVSLHFCRSARGINQSDPNSVLQGENVIKVVGHSPQSNVINMRNETKYHSANITHTKYDQTVNIQAGSQFDFPVELKPKSVLDLYSDIKKKRLAKRIVKRKKIRYVHILVICVFYIILFKLVNLIHFVLLNNIKGESENNDNMNVRMITRRIRRILGKIHSDKASTAEADNKRTVVNIKRKDITTVDNNDTLKDWKSLIRRKKDDMKRVLIKRVKAKKRDVNEHIESSKSKERFIVQKIRRHVQKEAEAAKNRILISELSLLFPFSEEKNINLII
ncbi:unnamed protein product [Schistosoma mattheei]|uniref:Uncharacterized protein n=1 Tax=Schistosoma mattheei TaxID=31246 RepID=A0A183P0L5_9TREM|nr:unnamed protein product [Schistosoma mattheei]